MRDSNQHTTRTPSPQYRHLVVAHGDAEATEQARIAVLAASYAPTAEDTAAAEWVQARPDLFVPLAAETLVSIGASPDALGLDPDLTARISEAMSDLLAPGPRLSLVPDLEPEAEAAI